VPSTAHSTLAKFCALPALFGIGFSARRRTREKYFEMSAVFFVFGLELPRLEEEEEEESSSAMYSSTFPTLLSSERLRGRTETKRETERKKQLETTNQRRAHTPLSRETTARSSADRASEQSED
jgi:hypothetical protein